MIALPRPDAVPLATVVTTPGGSCGPDGSTDLIIELGCRHRHVGLDAVPHRGEHRRPEGHLTTT
ncbi:hypothetical protein ACVGOW_11720 [Pseudonocardia saturnea]